MLAPEYRKHYRVDVNEWHDKSIGAVKRRLYRSLGVHRTTTSANHANRIEVVRYPLPPHVSSSA